MSKLETRCNIVSGLPQLEFSAEQGNPAKAYSNFDQMSC